MPGTWSTSGVPFWYPGITVLNPCRRHLEEKYDASIYILSYRSSQTLAYTPHISLKFTLGQCLVHNERHMSNPRQHSGQSTHLHLYKRAIKMSRLKQSSAKPPSTRDERNPAIKSQHLNTRANVHTNHLAYQTKSHIKSPPTANALHPPPTLPRPSPVGRPSIPRNLLRSPHLQDPPTRHQTLTRSPRVAQHRHPAYARLQVRPQQSPSAGLQCEYTRVV